MPDIMHLVRIHASRERVYQALTTAEDIRNWWTRDADLDSSGWDDTTITFDLRAEGSDTMLSLAHRGFKEANEGYAIVTTGRVYYLVSLQQYLETGEGTG